VPSLVPLNQPRGAGREAIGVQVLVAGLYLYALVMALLLTMPPKL
jgi:F0F1-type ATP synthase membrane subunit c/vacuolar-type H+-ATPase subunit K